MKVVTSKEMQAIDKKTIEGYGISGLVLMERAGLAVTQRTKELSAHKILVLCGSGNNGGDGLVVARNLHNAGYKVKVLMVGKKDRLSPDCMTQYKIAKKLGVPVEFRVKLKEIDLHGALVVDAIFGTGLSKEVTGKIAETISFLNDSGVPVVAVDIPSGISSDTGQVLGTAVRASITVTFGLPKRGHLLYPGAEYTGKLFVEDIGFPPKLFKNIKCELLEKDDMALLLPERPRYSHKGSYGHVLLVSGSKGKTGAAWMAAKACLRTGAGLVTIGVPDSLLDVLQSKVTEEMTLPLPDRGDGTLSLKALDTVLGFLYEKADILAIGPGIGTNEETQKLVHELLQRCTAPMVIDADGINALKGKTSLLKKTRAPVVLTPHPGEFARLTGKTINEIEKNRIDAAMAFSKNTGVYLILKGVPTVIAEPEGNVYINPTGNPGMAKAGVGDVLTGMTASLLAQGLSPLEASLLSVYTHGLAGDIASTKQGQHSLIASDIINTLHEAFQHLRTPCNT
jgi:NAD(P)H-hydrate epimerase